MCFSWNQFRVLSVLLVALLSSGCCLHKGGDELTAAQRQARDLHVQNQQLEQMARGLTSENQALLNQLAETQSQLGTMGERLNNLASEREGLLSDRMAQTFGDSVQDQLGAGLAADGFQYDPATGLNKFRSDILFDLGSDIVRPEAGPVLKEFASSLTGGAAKGMKVLVVGHTDDRPIAKESTKKLHPTNWHLSTNRANEVLLTMHKAGISENRMGSAGYSMFQPVKPNANEGARSQNRRVEVYVLAPDSPIALQMGDGLAPRSATNSDEWDPRMAK